MYVLSLAATIAFLVVWVVYLVGSGPGVHWTLLTVGCVLLFFVIVALTYQLAQALAARRYALKQEEFLSNITHEMKSPLAAIKLHAQTLQQPEDLAPDTRRRFAATIIIAFLPAAALGLLLHKVISGVFFESTTIIAGGFIVGGIIMLLAEHFRPAPTVDNAEKLSLKQAPW